MADSVMLFPQLLQPTAALKTYAPMSVKFWESQEDALDGMKEFADGWFAAHRPRLKQPNASAKPQRLSTSPGNIRTG